MTPAILLLLAALILLDGRRRQKRNQARSRGHAAHYAIAALLSAFAAMQPPDRRRSLTPPGVIAKAPDAGEAAPDGGAPACGPTGCAETGNRAMLAAESADEVNPWEPARSR